MREEQALVGEFAVRRPTMLENNKNPQRMTDLLLMEVDELLVEIKAGNENKIAQELPDVVWFALTIANLYGIDLENALWAKAIRNDHKYPEELFNNGMTYEDAYKLCRDNWDRDNDDNYTPEKI